MTISSNMSHVAKLFKTELSEEDRKATFSEMLTMVLAKATRADLVTDEAEIIVAQEVIKRYTGEEISRSELRVAANSKLFSEAPLRKYVARVSPLLPTDDKMNLLNALKDVLQADGHIRESELEFFDGIAKALNLNLHEIAGLKK